MLRKIYKNLRQLLPASYQSLLTQYIFQLSSKPFVKRDKIPIDKKFPGQQRGGVIISADFELAWAFRYSKKYSDPITAARSKALQARKNIPKLISLFEKYQTPITWATVGHLFLKSCKHGDHDWMKQIPHFDAHWRFKSGDWYEHDPYSNYRKNPEWYGFDLIESILNSPVKHEFGTHTFSHIDFSDKYCPPDVAADELSASFQAMSEFNVKPYSMVFPGGTYGNIPVLKQFGIEIYRRNTNVDLAYPYRDEFGLLVTPTSIIIEKTHNWDLNFYRKVFSSYIAKAIKTGTIAHFWFHPSLDDYSMENLFPMLMDIISEQRKDNSLWVGTMQTIANHINSNALI